MTASCLAQPEPENMAIHKPYTLSLEPNYDYCMDADDAVQLTDGVHTQGHFWTQKTTVGWTVAEPVIITVDLQQVEPVVGVSFSTAGGEAGVSWPWSACVLVSDDGESWTLAGDLVRLAAPSGGPPAAGYATHRFVTQGLRTRGRFVRFAVMPLPYTFVDEVEVYRGPDELLAQVPSGREVTDMAQLELETKGAHAMRSRLQADLRAAEQAIEGSDLPEADKAGLRAKTATLAAEIEALPGELPAGFTTVMPFSDLQTRVFALNAPVLRARGLPALTVWAQNRWDMLEPTQAPEQPTDSAPSLSLHMMRNEYRAEVFNLTNATDGALDVSVSIRGLPGGPNPQYVSVREVQFTDTYVRVPIAAALPEAPKTSKGYRISIPAGMTRQVWLAFHPTEVKAGAYQGEVRARAGDEVTDVAVPLALRIYPFDFPALPSIHVGGWDYTQGISDYDAAHVDQAEFIKVLREHFVDTPWAEGVAFDGLEFDGEGTLTAGPDLAAWDRWIAKWSGVRNYAVFLGVGDSFQGEEMGTERFDRMVGEWISAWVEHLQAQGLEARQLLLLLVDEPLSPEQDEVVIHWARAIGAAQSDVVIWEDPCHIDPLASNPEMYPECTVLSPTATRFVGSPQSYRDFFVAQQEAGRELWFYSCVNGKHLDPITYHRGQFWLAAKYGAKGSCYWAFGDEGGAGSSYKAYTSPGHMFSPLFLDANGITDGKHMEAIREGAEDYEYFAMLRRRVAEVEATGRTGAALSAAKELLDTGTDRVVADITIENLDWKIPKDRGIMDQVRVEVLEALDALRGM